MERKGTRKPGPSHSRSVCLLTYICKKSLNAKHDPVSCAPCLPPNSFRMVCLTYCGVCSGSDSISSEVPGPWRTRCCAGEYA